MKLNYSDNEGQIYVKINSPLGPGEEMIVQDEMECSFNVFTSMWFVEGETFVATAVELQLKGRVE